MSVNVVVGGTDPTLLSVLGTIGGTAASVLTAASQVPGTSLSRHYLKIHNPSSSASLAYTLDGTTPVVNGKGFTLGPLGKDEWDIVVPQGVVTLIASASSTPYALLVG